MSRNQKQIMYYAKKNGGGITLDEAVRLIGGKLYQNASKHVGQTLSRMVAQGMLERVNPGVFKVVSKPRRGWTTEAMERDIQAFKELDAMDADPQEEPEPGSGDDPWFGKHDMRDCDKEVDQ